LDNIYKRKCRWKYEKGKKKCICLVWLWFSYTLKKWEQVGYYVTSDMFQI
jgi:hypothetical protein